jgi:hypothetical protein
MAGKGRQTIDIRMAMEVFIMWTGASQIIDVGSS